MFGGIAAVFINVVTASQLHPMNQIWIAMVTLRPMLQLCKNFWPSL